MRPELFTIPILDYDVKSYGFMLMVGFLSAIWIATKRAEKMRTDPEIVINLGFCALVGGVIGARVMYVVHYWNQQFAQHPNPLSAALDFSGGGMEFLGGFIGGLALCVGYLVVRRESIRVYADLAAPAVMWGLAFGRLGCFLNGCCWGGMCEGTVAERWGLQFPFGSPAFSRQYEDRLVDVPAPLVMDRGSLIYAPSSGCGGCGGGHRLLGLESPGDWTRARRRYEQLQADYKYNNELAPDSEGTRKLEAQLEEAKKAAEKETQDFRAIEGALSMYPSREFPGQTMTPSEIIDLARAQHSLKVHPAQLYASANAVLCSLFLGLLLRVRKRHGVVFVVWLLTYPWTRIMLELIRVDNPKDSFGLTISQFLSVLMIATGVLLFIAWRAQPLHSPRAKAWTPELAK